MMKIRAVTIKTTVQAVLAELAHCSWSQLVKDHPMAGKPDINATTGTSEGKAEDWEDLTPYQRRML